MQVDTKLSSEIELMMELGFLKRHKKAEPDGLSPSFFKDRGEVLGLELTKLAGFFLFFNYEIQWDVDRRWENTNRQPSG